MYKNDELTYQQREVIDAKAKDAWWLFDVVTTGGTTYRWTDFSSKTWDGNTYTFKIVSMSDIKELNQGAETGIMSLSNVGIEIENVGLGIDPDDLEGATVTVRLILGARLAMAFAAGDMSFEEDAFETPDYQEIQALAWGFKVVTAGHSGNQSIIMDCENWLTPYLQGDYPNGRSAHDEFPDDTDMDDACVPKIFGTAYIPVKSVRGATKRYYLLGETGPTYTVSEVRAPKDWGSTVFGSGSYTFTDDTLTGRSADTYRGSEFKIADSGGTPVNGLFRQSGGFLDALAKYSCADGPDVVTDGDMEDDPLANWDDVNITLAEEAGTKHAGAKSLKMTAIISTSYAKQTIATKIGRRYDVAGWIYNDSGNSGATKGQIEARDTSGNLLGSAESASSDEWEEVTFSFIAAGTSTRIKLCPQNATDDVTYVDDVTTVAAGTASVTNPADVIEHVLNDFGIPSAKINATAQAAVAATFTGWGLAWAGGLFYKQIRKKVLSDLLVQCNMDIINRDTLTFRVRDKTPVLIIEEDLMLLTGCDKSGRGGKNSYRVHQQKRQDERDSLHVAYRPTGEPCDSLLKILVPADTTTAKPSKETLNMPFVHDSQHAQKLGTLAAQCKLNVRYDVEFLADPRCLRVEVGDVITLNNPNYGGPVNVRINTRRISKNLGLWLRGTVYTAALKNWADLSPGAITPAADDSSNVSRSVHQSYVDPVTGVVTDQVEGSISLAAGADVTLRGDDSDPGIIKWHGGSYNAQMGFNSDGDALSIKAGTDGDVDLFIGGDWDENDDYRFKYIALKCSESGFWQAGTKEYWFSTSAFFPDTHKDLDCGASAKAFDDIFGDDFQNVADFYYLDDKNDLDAINKIKSSGKIDQRSGLELIDDHTLPEWLLTKCKKTGKILYDPEGKPYIAIKTIISLLMGAIRELDRKIKNIEKK